MPNHSRRPRTFSDVGADGHELALFPDLNPGPVVKLDQSGRVVVANRAADGLFDDGAVGAQWQPVCPELADIHERLIDGEEVVQAEHTIGADVYLFTYRLGDDDHTFVYGASISELKAAQRALESTTEELRAAKERLEHLVDVDPLTDLLNRRGLERAIFHELKRARRGGFLNAAILLDCDDFRRINDVLGHAAGDAVLKEIAVRLRGSLRPDDRIGRIGGDEFLILLPETRLGEAYRIAHRLRITVSDVPLWVASTSVTVSASAGVTAIDPQTCSIEEILTRSHEALRTSKEMGKNRVTTAGEIASPGGDAQAQASAQFLALISQQGSFRGVSQALIRLDDGEVVGHELLSRGPEPYVSPADFLRLALECNALTSTDLRCLKACISTTNERGLAGEVHVNLFPSTILDTPADRLIALFPPESIGRYCIEISEQQLIGSPMALRERLAELRSAGLRIAVDDVGFGRSSLESLILLEPDVVKIDRSFVSGIGKSVSKQNAMQRLCAVIDALGAESVAEGVEDEDEARVVSEIGAKYAQGYLWGRPC